LVKQLICLVDVEMSKNPHLEPQLDAYAQLSNPGFALLLDAPWGAGKTCALKAWLSGRTDALYVSLYGAKSADAIEEILFQNLLDTRDVKIPTGVTQLLEGVTEKLSGAKVDLTGTYRRLVMKDLPRILVFDDLERTEMPLAGLFSVLNRFVEHEGRRVILLANQAELRSSHEVTYERTKEKVIGRVISIAPDVSAAIDSFLNSMMDDEQQHPAYELLKSEKDLLSSVFETSQSFNLRLLRYAILEFARVLERIPMDMRENKDGMRYLLATFVALSIEFHGGAGFGIEELGQQGNWERTIWEVNGKKGQEPPKTSLQLLQERFQKHPFVQIDGQVISSELALEWIGKGHVEVDFLSRELGKSAVFRSAVSEAWQTLWWWPLRPEVEVDVALKAVKRQMADKEICDPDIIMHLAGIMLSLADAKIEWNTRGDAVGRVRTYLAELEQANLLPTRACCRHSDSGFP